MKPYFHLFPKKAEAALLYVTKAQEIRAKSLKKIIPGNKNFAALESFGVVTANGRQGLDTGIALILLCHIRIGMEARPGVPLHDLRQDDPGMLLLVHDLHHVAECPHGDDVLFLKKKKMAGKTTNGTKVRVATTKKEGRQ